MMLRHPVRNALLVMALGAALAGAGRLSPASKAHFRVNLERWAAFSESQRDELRASWRLWLQRPAGQRELAEERFAILRRLREGVELSGVGEATPDRLAAELTWELEGLTQQVRREVPGAPTDIGLRDAVELLFHRRIEAFVDHLEARGRLPAGERARLLALPARALADEGRQRLKAEYLALLSGDAAVDLAACDPRDVPARIDERRRQVGFLGRAGAVWPLSAEERDALARLPSATQVLDTLRPMRAAAIRKRLQGHPLTAEQVDALLALPWNELERSLDALLTGP